MTKAKVVFLGSSDFAVPALERLNESADVELVITQPDKKSGRGNKVRFLPVKKKALELGLEVYQPQDVSDKKSLEKIRDLQPDFLIVCSYGQILRPEVLEIAKKDNLNIHASLLPAYRGPSPIQTAILNGDDKSGVTIMKVDEGMDTGDIISSFIIPIDESTTAEKLHDRLAVEGADLLLSVLDNYDDVILKSEKQNDGDASYTAKIQKEDAKIDFKAPSKKVVRQINAFDSFPGAYVNIGGQKVKFFSPEIYNTKAGPEPGTVLSKDLKQGLIVATEDGAVKINEIQFPGKKRMKVDDFFKGNTLNATKL